MATNNSVNVGLSGATGSGNFVGANTPTLITPLLGTPTSGNLSNCTAYPVASLSGLGTGVATALAANVTGSGGIALATSPSLTTPTLGAATATSLAFSPTTGGIIGTTTNDSAGAGKVGEIISSEVLIGSPVSISSNVAKDITTISLTAGQWNVYANIGLVGATGTTVDTMIGCINTSTAITPASRRTFVAYGTSFAIGTGDIEAVVPSQPMQLSGTTTIHLVIQSQFGVSTMSAFGFIWAVRAR